MRLATPHIPPEEIYSLSETARLAFIPAESLRRKILRGSIVPDFRSRRGMFFRTASLGEILSKLRKNQ